MTSDCFCCHGTVLSSTQPTPILYLPSSSLVWGTHTLSCPCLITYLVLPCRSIGLIGVYIYTVRSRSFGVLV
ncbi:hypothetical protein BD311DRAFT_6389 [Dichomitus squalens]|uniref:Uncharacterized protein n=1 Tax=Dichomitus squalens TaxID=114155 RepID=A0A4Q9N662_9APHY|nr:hypothetical protein BD311DRAFT_6389 [Dichomitus squalens]